MERLEAMAKGETGDVSHTVAPGTPPLGPPWGLTVRPQVGTGWAGVSAPGGDIYVHM